jgi:glycerophosphoryl diester phosphodiesterase
MGIKLHVWTINNEQVMNDLIRTGVNGIMTDNCQLLKKVMINNIVW